MTVLDELVALLRLEKLEEISFAVRARTLAGIRSLAVRCSGKRCRRPRKRSRRSDACTRSTPIFAPRRRVEADHLRGRSDPGWRLLHHPPHRRDSERPPDSSTFSTSFQKEEPGFEHQAAMPTAPDPESVPKDTDRFKRERPIDLRIVGEQQEDPANRSRARPSGSSG